MSLHQPWQIHVQWTDERCDKLRKLWSQGMSASLIGAELGVSRCAVIGKVHRLKLARHVVTARKPKPRSRLSRGLPPVTKREYRHVRVAQPPKKTLAELFALGGLTDLPPDQSPLAKTLFELIDDRSQCRFPVSPPPNAESSLEYFCACDVVEGKPYCPRHYVVAHRGAAALGQFRSIGEVALRVVSNLEQQRRDNDQAA